MAFSTMIRTFSFERPKFFIRDIILPINHQDPRLREFRDGAYRDYYGFFSWQEVRDLNEKRLSDTSFQREGNLKLRKFLEGDSKNQHFIIQIAEWESGLD